MADLVFRGNTKLIIGHEVDVVHYSRNKKTESVAQ